MRKLILPLILSIVVLALAFLPVVNAEPVTLPESYKTSVTLTAAGSDGAATGSVSSPYLRGYLRGIYIDYGASVTITTDVTIARTSPAGTVMVKSNSATDAWFYPSVQFTDAAGAAISGVYGRFPVDDILTISAAQSTSGTVAVITLMYGD